MKLNLVDLHIHTTYSDGCFSPSDVVRMAKDNFLKAIAITDHDCIDGVASAVKAGVKYSIEIIPGIELSADYHKELHILGYFIDVDSPTITLVLKKITRENMKRIKLLLREFRKININLAIDEIAKNFGGVNKNAIAKYLVDTCIVASEEEAMDEFFSGDKSTNIEMMKLTPKACIETIKSAHGTPVLAHPGRIGLHKAELMTLVAQLKEFGLRGIECWHPDHDFETISECIRMSQHFDLCITGGSDFHGTERKKYMLNQVNGISYKNVTNLREHII